MGLDMGLVMTSSGTSSSVSNRRKRLLCAFDLHLVPYGFTADEDAGGLFDWTEDAPTAGNI